MPGESVKAQDSVPYQNQITNLRLGGGGPNPKG